MRTFTYGIMTFVMIIAAGCDEPPTGTTMLYAPGFQSERSPYVLNGTVVTAANAPVAGAEIHCLFTMSSITTAPRRLPAKAMPTTTISFSIPTGAHVTLKVFRLGTRELVATLVDTTLLSGHYAVSANVSALTNGVYVYQLIADKLFSEKLLVLLNEDLSVLTNAVPLARTDRNGNFQLRQSVFGLDEQFLVTSETSPDVIGVHMIDSIGIVIHRTGSTQVFWMRIDKHNNMFETFTLK
jgi:hypothetical protein